MYELLTFVSHGAPTSSHHTSWRRFPVSCVTVYCIVCRLGVRYGIYLPAGPVGRCGGPRPGRGGGHWVSSDQLRATRHDPRRPGIPSQGRCCFVPAQYRQEKFPQEFLELNVNRWGHGAPRSIQGTPLRLTIVNRLSRMDL